MALAGDGSPRAPDALFSKVLLLVPFYSAA